MGTVIAKVSPESTDNRYLLYDTIPSGFVFFGTRKQVRKYLKKRWGTDSLWQIDRSLELADKNGSDSAIGRLKWGAPGVDIQVPQGEHAPHGWLFLPRERLDDYWDLCQTWLEDDGGLDEPDVSRLGLKQPTCYEEDEEEGDLFTPIYVPTRDLDERDILPESLAGDGFLKFDLLMRDEWLGKGDGS